MSPQHVVLTGATGLIGAQLASALVARGDRVTALVRDPARAHLPSEVARAPWDLHHPKRGDGREVLATADKAPPSSRRAGARR